VFSILLDVRSSPEVVLEFVVESLQLSKIALVARITKNLYMLELASKNISFIRFSRKRRIYGILQTSPVAGYGIFVLFYF
jgi:hypothetical protein